MHKSAKVKVNRATWTRVIVESMQKDKVIDSLQEKLAGRDAAGHIGWCQALESVCGSLRGYPEHGGDTEVMTEVEKIAVAARRAGQEDVLTLLESYGYSEPPRLSGRGMAAMLRKRLAIIAQAAPVVQITPNRRCTYPEKHTATVTPPCTPQRCYRTVSHTFICPAQKAGISQERK